MKGTISISNEGNGIDGVCLQSNMLDLKLIDNGAGIK